MIWDLHSKELSHRCRRDSQKLSAIMNINDSLGFRNLEPPDTTLRPSFYRGSHGTYRI